MRDKKMFYGLVFPKFWPYPSSSQREMKTNYGKLSVTSICNIFATISSLLNEYCW